MTLRNQTSQIVPVGILLWSVVVMSANLSRWRRTVRVRIGTREGSSNAPAQRTSPGVSRPERWSYARGRFGIEPLHLAAGYTENLAVVSALLKAGADAKARDEFDRNSLHWAEFNRNPAIAAALLKAGAELSARDDSGRTPLHKTALNDNPQVVTTLIEAGGEPNATGRAWTHATALRGVQRKPRDRRLRT